jgi:hypothetical protein
MKLPQTMDKSVMAHERAAKHRFNGVFSCCYVPVSRNLALLKTQLKEKNRMIIFSF